VSDLSFLDATRDSYDATVVEYVEMIDGHLETHPLEQALLSVFAELIRGGGNRRVADVGCGPGRLTTFLSQVGLDAFGIDLSPGMIAHARRTYPELRFEVGSMLDLDLADASLGGLLAWYSVIHVPWERRPDVFAEFHRVLAPGGRLMLAFQVGHDKHHRDEVFGKKINCDWHRQQPDEIVDLLRAAGFDHWSTTVRAAEKPVAREGDAPQPLPQGYVIATKPA
jgi:SAM-dependent methyltransferase